MKPYTCAICDEHFDARDNPPTTVINGLLCEECAAEFFAEDASPFEMGEPAYWSPEVDR